VRQSKRHLLKTNTLSGKCSCTKKPARSWLERKTCPTLADRSFELCLPVLLVEQFYTAATDLTRELTLKEPDFAQFFYAIVSINNSAALQ
jgi:hypothetical protein